jgi:hypothetical protein
VQGPRSGPLRGQAPVLTKAFAHTGNPKFVASAGLNKTFSEFEQGLFLQMYCSQQSLNHIRGSVFRLIAETQLDDDALPISRQTEGSISTLRQLSPPRELHAAVSAQQLEKIQLVINTCCQLHEERRLCRLQFVRGALGLCQPPMAPLSLCTLWSLNLAGLVPFEEG